MVVDIKKVKRTHYAIRLCCQFHCLLHWERNNFEDYKKFCVYYKLKEEIIIYHIKILTAYLGLIKFGHVLLTICAFRKFTKSNVWTMTVFTKLVGYSLIIYLNQKIIKTNLNQLHIEIVKIKEGNIVSNPISVNSYLKQAPDSISRNLFTLLLENIII